jgi:hypothetical protein
MPRCKERTQFFTSFQPPVEVFASGSRLLPLAATILPAAGFLHQPPPPRDARLGGGGSLEQGGRGAGLPLGQARHTYRPAQSQPGHAARDSSPPCLSHDGLQEGGGAWQDAPPQGSYEDDLSRPTTSVFVVDLDEDGSQVAFVVPDFAEDGLRSYCGIKVCGMRALITLHSCMFHPALIIVSLQVNSYRFVYRVHLLFSDGPGYIYLCSCMSLAWESLEILNVRGSTQAECAHIGGMPCRHSLAVEAVFEAPDNQTSPSSSFRDIPLRPMFSVQLIELVEGSKVRLMVDCGPHPCSDPDSLGLIGNDTGLFFKCFSCGNGSYNCKHMEKLVGYLDNPDGPDDFLLSLASFSLHPRSEPSCMASNQSWRRPADVNVSSQVHQSVSYKLIPERLRNAATSARAVGTFVWFPPCLPVYVSYITCCSCR